MLAFAPVCGRLLVKPFEFGISTLHDGLGGAGVPGAYGFSIILFTLLLKALTFPLNKQQIESTSKMQAIQPAAKQLQEKYRNKDPCVPPRATDPPALRKARHGL